MRVPDSEYMKGLASVSDQIGQILGHVEGMTEDAMRKIVVDVQAVAQEKAPVETGDLSGSAYSDIKTEGDDVVGSIHFPLPYAAAQHEHVEYHHPIHGEAKYLEKAGIEKAEQIREQMAADLRALFGGG